MQMLQEMMDGTLQEKKDAKDEGLFEDEDWMLQVRLGFSAVCVVVPKSADAPLVWRQSTQCTGTAAL